MKEAFVANILNMIKIPGDNEQDIINSEGNVSHDAGIGHADDDECNHLFVIICTHYNE